MIAFVNLFLIEFLNIEKMDNLRLMRLFKEYVNICREIFKNLVIKN